MDKIVNLCKRRGFVFPSAEIYGGFRSTYDYGPIGVLMLRNVKDAWWRTMVQLRTDVVGLDAAILSPPAVWEASGHLAELHRSARRLPQLQGAVPPGPPRGSATCARTAVPAARLPRRARSTSCSRPTPARSRTSATVAYLRPETAQGMFTNFANVVNTSRKKPPFGIAQVGKSFRNEITPGNFVFRTREFEQMEMEFFVPPAEGPAWYRYWCEERLRWYQELGIPAEKLRLRPHDADELSHYSAGTSDVEFLFPWGWGELEGIANRTDYDLNQHARHSGVDLSYFDQESATRYVPHVIEPAAGATRSMMAFLLAGYDEEEVRGETRTVLRLHPRLAPYKVAVLPLSKKEQLDRPRPRRARRGPAALDVRLRRDAGHRPSLPPPGRDRYAVLRHGRLRVARGQGRHRPRAGLDAAGARRHRRPRRPPAGVHRLLSPRQG